MGWQAMHFSDSLGKKTSNSKVRQDAGVQPYSRIQQICLWQMNGVDVPKPLTEKIVTLYCAFRHAPVIDLYGKHLGQSETHGPLNEPKLLR